MATKAISLFRRALVVVVTIATGMSVMVPAASSAADGANGWTLRATGVTSSAAIGVNARFTSPAEATGKYVLRTIVRTTGGAFVTSWSTTQTFSGVKSFEFRRDFAAAGTGGSYKFEQEVRQEGANMRIAFGASSGGTFSFPVSPLPTTTSTSTSTSTTTTEVPTTTTTTEAPTTTTTAPPAGNAGDLNGWKYIFGDDFKTDAAEGQFLNTYRNWGAYNTGWPDTSRRGMYDQNILSVNGGMLNMRLHTGADGKPRVAVPFPLINGRDAADRTNQLYGRYEVRFRADQVPGYKTAFLLWPKSEVWPRDGEIDFPEADLTGKINAFMHRQGGTWGGDQDWFGTNTFYGDWHTAVIEWAPNYVKFVLDGHVIGTSTSRIPNTPMRWVLQTETCLGSCTTPAGASGYVQFDYVKVWSHSPTTVAG